jgi:hypothetical protein
LVTAQSGRGKVKNPGLIPDSLALERLCISDSE